VNTVGVNMPAAIGHKGLADMVRLSMETNFVSHLTVLQEWLARLPETPAYWTRQYISISSNSASLPRTRSLPYCASKAALSMALRVAARELAGVVSVYGYEPGLLFGTPMTEEWSVGKSHRMHRMRGGPELRGGIRPGRLARMIVGNIVNGGPELNGCLIRVDGGEQ
jgi:NAD(P)-dependent dehydrogenase (short-subunit alcohol dehydrogenase family)